MEANFMGMKYDLKWQDPDRCSRVVVINYSASDNEHKDLFAGERQRTNQDGQSFCNEASDLEEDDVLLSTYESDDNELVFVSILMLRTR
ncbi:hypothetical protein OWV82_008686 [Melia azedarach]|uniref:Uncharacterized protein n=1 Tax=Melia azedarach TaxID=155640 RepID=A0ACC1YE85_MELAZ|nr:hypothetical protein OWV82_008686 [Melia azedarach]